MPRYYYSGARDTTNGAKKISIFWLRKNKYLNSNNDKCHYYGNINWSSNGESRGKISFEIETDENKGPYIQFIYRAKKAWEPEEAYRDINYKFDLISQTCRYGGKRWYFRCSLYKNQQYCGKRVAILYQVGDYFGCRNCADLSYNSCNKSKKYRSGVFGMLFGSYDPDEYYQTLKRFYYRGKPTRKYRKYLKMDRFSDEYIALLEVHMKKIISGASK